MKRLIIFLFSVIYATSIGAQESEENSIRQLFEIELNHKNVKNAFLQVYSKSKKINIQFSDGIFKNGDSVSSNNPFYTASIGKMFTSTSIAILKEQGKLNFNDKIDQFLSKETLNKLHFLEGIDSSHKITIAQLMQHTSGLPDYFEDVTIDGSPNIITQLFLKPNKYWFPKECIQFVKDKMKPKFLPGNGYHYTDTEYILLGLIIEKISGYSLHEFFKEYIFKPLKMSNTYMFLRSLPLKQTKKIAEIYFSEIEISSFKSLTADWAGGAIVSTTKDLITFQKALISGELLKNETLQKMQDWTPETEGMYYGYGFRKIVLNELSPNFPKLDLIGHSGSTGSFLFYCPQFDTHISGTLNQVEANKNALVLIVNILNELYIKP